MTSDVNLLHLHAIRIGKEPSRAAPQSHYSDPANVVKLASESNCGTCLYSGSGTKGHYCGKFQVWGKRCEFFRMVKR